VFLKNIIPEKIFEELKSFYTGTYVYKFANFLKFINFRSLQSVIKKRRGSGGAGARRCRGQAEQGPGGETPGRAAPGGAGPG
jgi:hypothetical protein